MKEYLIFRLYGPISSWGEIAVGENRHSFSYPSKSAIVGLIASAFGYRREEEDKHKELSDSLGFGVKVWNPGVLLRDYHTIQTPPSKGKIMYSSRKEELREKLELNTILSSRDYRMDSLYDISIWTRNELLKISEVLEKFSKPVFSLFLGRKSCVISSPLFVEVIKADDVFDGFNKYDSNLIKRFKSEEVEDFFESLKSQSKISEYIWEEESEDKANEIRTRRDEVLSRKRWQFSERKEFYKSEVKQDVPIESGN